MARANPIITNFTAGELSELLGGRYDLTWYQNGARLCENMIVLPQGPATRRPGTRFIAGVRDSAKKSRLVDFEFSTEQAYQLEFSEGQIRFFKAIDRGVILDDSAVTNGDFPADVAGWTDISAGTGAIAWNAAGHMDLTGAGAGNEARATQELESLGTSQYTITLDVLDDAVTWKAGTSSGASDIGTGSVALGTGQSFSFTPAAAGSVWLTFENAAADTRGIDNVVLDNPVYQIESPYQEADLPGLRWVQSADVLYLDHAGYAPRKVNRFGNSHWTLEQVDFIDGPYLDQNTETGWTLAPSATTGSITVTAAGFPAGQEPFAATDAGRLVRIKHSTTWGYAKVTGFTSATLVDAEVVNDFGGTGASSEWQLGLWSETTGYPSAWPIFHQERLGHGGQAVLPDRFDLSRSGDFENMTPGADADDAIARRLASDQVNAIKWLVSKTQLFIGTLARTYRAVGDELNAALTPAAVDAKPMIRHGSADLKPTEIGKTANFVDRHGRRIFEVFFSPADDDFNDEDILARAEHLTSRTRTLVDWAYQEMPYRCIWAVRSDGLLLGCTRLRGQQVLAWHRHPLGGSAAGAAEVESVSVIPGDGADEVWLIVKRTIDGQVKRTIEIIGDEFDADTEQADAFFVDSGLTYDGAPVTAISGAGHLEGETVQILVDGRVHPDQVVVSGQVTLDYAGSKVHLGLGSVARLKPVRLEAGGLLGTAQGQLKRIHEVTVRLYRSLGFKIGRDEDHLEQQPFGKSGDPMDAPAPLFSGDWPVSFAGDWENEGNILIVQDQPLPLTVVALMPKMKNIDR